MREQDSRPKHPVHIGKLLERLTPHWGVEQRTWPKPLGSAMLYYIALCK